VIELFEQSIKTVERQSSKGNQLKWENSGIWYKADYVGYEGLAEYIVSHLLKYSTLAEDEFVYYDFEKIKYKKNVYRGVKSQSFIRNDWQIVTLERLFKNRYGKSLYEELWHIDGVDERAGFLVDQVRIMTGLADFDKYFNKLMTVDAFFLNEDRHMHNIAVMMNSKGEFDYCRIFDNGACLLSDTTLDYPLGEDVYDLMDESQSKTISRDYDEQLDASEKMAGHNIKFSFTRKDVELLLGECTDLYGKEIVGRVEKILLYQMRKYSYLFE